MIRLNSSFFTVIRPPDLVDVSVVGIEAGNSPSDAVTDAGSMGRRKERKMKHGMAVPVLLLLVFAAGCGQANRVKVTYRSNPPGGVLYKQNGEVWGSCPKVLWYDLDEETIKNGYLDAKGLIVRWPSGPERRSDDLIRVTVNGTDRRVIFTQPRMQLSASK